MQRRGLSFGAGCEEDHFVEVDSYAIAFSGLSVRIGWRGNSMGLIFDARNHIKLFRSAGCLVFWIRLAWSNKPDSTSVQMMKKHRVKPLEPRVPSGYGVDADTTLPTTVSD